MFKQYYEPLYYFAGRFVWDQSSAENIVQDFFVKLWEKRESLQINTSLKAYMYTSVKNLSLNFIKREDFYSEIGDEHWNEDEKDPIKILEENEMTGAIHKAIEELPAKCKEIFWMCRFDNLSYQEVADIQDVSINTVKTQLQRAMKMLSVKLSHLKFLILVCTLIIRKIL